MKNITTRHLAVALLLLASLSAMSQDFLNIYFKDGTFRIFHFDSFKSLSVSKIDADGIAHDDYMFQHVVSGGKEFVYNLADIDSISFTKYNEQEAGKNMTRAMNAILPELKDCDNINQASAKLEAINQSDGVEKAWIEGDYMFVKIRDMETIMFCFHPQDVESDTEQMAEVAQQLMQTMPAPRQVNNHDGVKLKAVIANSQHYEHSNWRINQRNIMNGLVDQFQKAGFDCNYCEEPDLDFFSNKIYDYDVVYLSAHGGYYPNSLHFLQTGQYLRTPTSPEYISVSASQNDFNNWVIEKDQQYRQFLSNHPEYSYDDLIFSVDHKEKRINGEVYVASLAIKETFFEHVTKNFKNPRSVFFNAACMTLKGGSADENDETENYSFANILTNRRGLGIYLGYTNSNTFGQQAGAAFFLNMLCGISADKAYNQLAEYKINPNDYSDYRGFLGWYYEELAGTYKDEEITKSAAWGLSTTTHYFARLKLLPEGSNCFITPVYTREHSHDEVMNSYRTDGSVMVSATTTTIDPSKISMGFKYGTNKNALNEWVPSETVMKTIDSGKGNYLVISHIKNLQAGNTYYYCGYTYDGEHYNYGDTLAFTIDNPVIITTKSARVKSILLNQATYRPNGFDFNGTKYNFSYSVSATAEISGGDAPVEWGFDVMGPDGNTVVRHRAVDDNTSNPWAFLVVANEPSTVLRVRAYAIWQQGGEATEGEWQTFDLFYSTDTSLQLNNVTFSGTTQGAVYNGQSYKYKSSFRFVYTVTGGYWQQVSPKEEGNGWENWPLPERKVRPADGANATTINYYYNDRTFSGDYSVRLQSDCSTQALKLQSTGYAHYIHDGATFTGCTYHNGTSPAPAHQAPAQTELIFDNGEINIIIP